MVFLRTSPENIADLTANVSSTVVLPLLITCLCAICRHADATEYCLPETVNVTCAVNEIILVTSAQYGRMRSGRCIKQNYGHVGCEADVTAFMEDECSGRRQCQLPVARLLGVASPCPPDVTSYLDVTHSCVNGETAVNGRCCH